MTIRQTPTFSQPPRTWPWMNGLLIAANLAAFLAQQRDPAILARAQLSAASLNLPAFVTYAFVHIGWAHLLLNLLMLYILGNTINRRFGQLGYLGFYLASAVFAGVGYIQAGGHAVVGASGAVGAVMGAYLALLPRSNISLNVLIGRLEVPSMYFVVVFFVYNLVMSFASHPETPQVAYEAHVAGVAFGFLVAVALLLARLLPRQGSDFPAVLHQWITHRKA